MRSLRHTFEFIQSTAEDLNALTSVREGEVKLGEMLKAGFSPALSPKYIVLGISEDLGPQANGGFPGSVTAYGAFLKRFLNVQSNRFLTGDSIGILGEIRSLTDFQGLAQAREAVQELDDFVVEVLRPYVAGGSIPIVIGGGHNNAYPLIKTASLVWGQPVSAINFDPHADFRPLEGRHSGNPFSYAFHEGLLDFYAVLGLHQSYNSRFILEELEKHQMLFSCFDDYLSGAAVFEQDLNVFAQRIHQKPFGLELDMDSIAFMLSSAFSPSGMLLEQARQYVLKMAHSANAKYFHLPEAAPKTPQEEAIVGKALAYLVTDFIKANSELK